MAKGGFSLDEWNYAKKAGKIVIIYTVAVWLFISTVDLLTGIQGTGGFTVNGYLLSLLILFGYFLTIIFIYPGVFISAFINFPLQSHIPYNPKFLSILFYSAVFWVFLGFLFDLNKKGREGEREKGVFLRIPLGGRNIVISEKFVNYLIFAEILILVIFTAFTSM